MQFRDLKTTWRIPIILDAVHDSSGKQWRA